MSTTQQWPLDITSRNVNLVYRYRDPQRHVGERWSIFVDSETNDWHFMIDMFCNNNGTPELSDLSSKHR